MRTSTRHPLPFDLQKSKRLSKSSLMKLKCNSRTNTTLTLTNFFCPLCTPRSTGDTSTTPGLFALDVGWHCLPILKTPDELPVVVDVSAQDGQKELQDATLFCRVPLQLTNFGALCKYSLSLEKSTEQKYLPH